MQAPKRLAKEFLAGEGNDQGMSSGLPARPALVGREAPAELERAATYDERGRESDQGGRFGRQQRQVRDGVDGGARHGRRHVDFGPQQDGRLTGKQVAQICRRTWRSAFR